MKTTNKTLPAIIGGLILYLFSAGSSFAIFNYLLTPGGSQGEIVQPKTSSNGFVVDENAPKTEECPLNGQMRSKAERDLWEKRRPLGIMVENHEDSRPQSGLTSADIIYEAVAEGGITRLLTIYYCQGKEVTVGPVRSARTYFLDFISEYGNKPLYTHVGGANSPGPANALGQIEDYGWVGQNDLNQFSIGFPTFWRDYERLGREVATEHTVYTSTNKLWEAAKKRGFTNIDEDDISWDENFVPWKFQDDSKTEKTAVSQTISFGFWEGYGKYNVKWVYNPTGNGYKRINGGVPLTDKNNDQQITAKNIVLLFMTEENANDGYENNLHLLYGTIGKGKMVLIQNGEKIEGTWEKEERESRMVLTDADGSEIKFVRGQIWLEVLPIGTKVTYQ